MASPSLRVRELICIAFCVYWKSGGPAAISTWVSLAVWLVIFSRSDAMNRAFERASPIGFTLVALLVAFGPRRLLAGAPGYTDAFYHFNPDNRR